MLPPCGDAACAPRGNLEVAAAPAPVAPAAARRGSGKSRAGTSSAPSSCASEEDDAARRRVADPTERADDEDDEDDAPRRSGVGFTSNAGDVQKTGAARGKGGDAKPVTPETARRREVIARAMAVASAAAEAKAAAQRLDAKEARAVAARRAKARIRGETSPEQRLTFSRDCDAPSSGATAPRDKTVVRGLGVRLSPSPSKTKPFSDDGVVTYATRFGVSERNDPDAAETAAREAAAETTEDADDAAEAVAYDAAREMWGGLWRDVRATSELGRSEAAPQLPRRAFRRRRTGRNDADAGGAGAAAARRAREEAKKRAHKAQVAFARAADAGGITGWACDEESDFAYESPDGPFLAGAVAAAHLSAPSGGDAPKPAARDWSTVKARVVCRRNADAEE